MRRASKITLTIMSSLCVGGCDSGDEHWTRNYYYSREKCVADYSETQCRPSGGGALGYLGPPYRTDTATRDSNDPGPGRTGKADGQTRYVQRGGFGSSGRSFGGSYS